MPSDTLFMSKQPKPPPVARDKGDSEAYIRAIWLPVGNRFLCLLRSGLI